MFCPRCGADNAEDNRFCVSCGHRLDAAKEEEPRKTLRQRLARLLGRSRKERLITAATAAAVVVAVVSLLTLDPDQDDVAAPDPAADVACITAKRTVASAASRAQRAESGGLEAYSTDLIVAMLEFRGAARELVPASDTAVELDLALRDAAIEAGTLARLAREGRTGADVDAQVEQLDAATTRIDAAIEELGLDQCAELRIGPAVAEQTP